MRIVDAEFDASNNYAFQNILPPESVDALNKIKPEMFDEVEDNLEMYCMPTPSMNRVRLAFQRVYHECKEMRHPEINWPALAKRSDVTMRALAKMFTTPNQLLWILCPIVGVHKMMEEAYYEALRKIRQAVSAPIYLPDGTLDNKTVNTIFKLYQHLDKRQFGEFKQDITIKDTTDKPAPKNIVDVDIEIRELEEKLKQLGHVEAEESPDVKPPEAEVDDELKARARERGIAFKAKET